MPEQDLHPLCKAVRRAIAAKNVRVKDLAAYLGVDPSSVTRYIHGSRIPDPEIVLRIGDYLGLRRGALLIEGYECELPVKPEDFALIDNRLDDVHKSLARSYYLSCINDSVPESTSIAAPAEVRTSVANLISTSA